MWQLRDGIPRSRGDGLKEKGSCPITTEADWEGTGPICLGRHVWTTRRADKAPLQGEVGCCSSDCSVPPDVFEGLRQVGP